MTCSSPAFRSRPWKPRCTRWRSPSWRAFLVALALAGFIGTGFVRLSLRPLRRVAATATRVTQLPLASGEVTLPRRVPDTSPRTEPGQVARRSTGCSATSSRRSPAGGERRPGCAASPPTPATSCAPAGRHPRLRELALRNPDADRADIEHALHRVESESARMSVLVDELLLLAQLDAGRPLAREPVDLTRLAIDATATPGRPRADHRWVLELPQEACWSAGMSTGCTRCWPT